MMLLPHITWKNILGLLMFISGIKSLFVAITKGKLRTGWIIFADYKDSKIEFVFYTLITAAYTLICGYAMLGFINTEDDYNFLSLVSKIFLALVDIAKLTVSSPKRSAQPKAP